jgi:hypothetical protein
MEKLTITELEGQSVELLPSRETLFLNFHINWASVMAQNTSTAASVLTFGSWTGSNAMQTISVSQQ